MIAFFSNVDAVVGFCVFVGCLTITGVAATWAIHSILDPCAPCTTVETTP